MFLELCCYNFKNGFLKELLEVVCVDSLQVNPTASHQEVISSESVDIVFFLFK